MRYHIKKDGKPGVCKANARPCPLGGDEAHFDTIEAATKAANDKMEGQCGLMDAKLTEDDYVPSPYLKKEEERLKQALAEAKARGEGGFDQMSQLSMLSDIQEKHYNRFFAAPDDAYEYQVLEEKLSEAIEKESSGSLMGKMARIKASKDITKFLEKERQKLREDEYYWNWGAIPKKTKI